MFESTKEVLENQLQEAAGNDAVIAAAVLSLTEVSQGEPGTSHAYICMVDKNEVRM